MSETFGQRIKRLRLAAGYSQRKLAKLIGISAGLVSFIERDRNRPNYQIVRKLASVFECSTDFLINGEPSQFLVAEMTRSLLDETNRQLVGDRNKALFNAANEENIADFSGSKLLEKVLKLPPEMRLIVIRIIERIEAGNRT